jgi:hypothetical protein
MFPSSADNNARDVADKHALAPYEMDYNPYASTGLHYQSGDPDAAAYAYQSPSKTDTEEDRLLSLHRGKRQRLGCTLVLPTLLVVLGTAGIATVLLLWLLLHKADIPGNSIWQQKAFIVDEGHKNEGGAEAARLLGLTISSAAVCNAILTRTSC